MLSCSIMKQSAARLRARSRARGFTLAELMAVVAITGILAALAIAALHHRAFESDVTSAKVVVKEIVAAEEHYRAENQVYCDVSSAGASWYPASIPAHAKVSFWLKGPNDTTDSETQKWRALSPDIRQTVSFGFKANAGLPTSTPKFDDALTVIPIPTVNEPWYVIQARADADGDGVPCMIAAVSWNPEVVSVNDGE